ncbi:MAG: DUF3489 domain-containing protein [Pseudomonadota bacterium]|nr:DUF3489 domain-containing protein [Pseudomonadota bacterium]
MTTLQLTATQHAVLAHAIHHTDGKIDWFPENINGGVRKKVIAGLFNRALITPNGTDWFVAAEGYAALGCTRPAPITPEAGDADANNAEAAQYGASQVLLDEIGGEDPTDAEIEASHEVDPEIEAAVAAIEAKAHAEAKPPRTRDNSKQATVIQMLQRPEGATIPQIMAATGWQAHTVRGTFAGAFKKKLGMNLISEKVQGGERVYHVA